MRTRPGTIVTLAALQGLSPLLSLSTGAALSGMGFGAYVSALHGMQPWSLWLGLVGAQALSAFAIYSVKPWSIPVVLGIGVWDLFSTTMSVGAAPGYLVPAMIALWCLANMALVFYFLVPAVYEVYLTKHLKWWESKPRYSIELQAYSLGATTTVPVLIREISSEGVFFECETQFALGEELRIAFEPASASGSPDGTKLNLTGKVAHQTRTSLSLVGLRFATMGRAERKILCAYLGELERSGTPRKPERVAHGREYAQWLRRVLSTGKGILPESEEQHGAQARGAGAGSKREAA